MSVVLPLSPITPTGRSWTTQPGCQGGSLHMHACTAQRPCQLVCAPPQRHSPAAGPPATPRPWVLRRPGADAGGQRGRLQAHPIHRGEGCCPGGIPLPPACAQAAAPAGGASAVHGAPAACAVLHSCVSCLPEGQRAGRTCRELVPGWPAVVGCPVGCAVWCITATLHCIREPLHARLSAGGARAGSSPSAAEWPVSWLQAQ